MYRAIGLIALLFTHSAVLAQTAAEPTAGSSKLPLRYTYAELRFVDYNDNGGDGLRLNGSWDLGNNWLIVGGVTDIGFNDNVDVTSWEIGGGYVWRYAPDWDIVGTARFVRADIDTPGGSSDDNGLALSGGTRGMLSEKFEVRGSLNYINVDDRDTYLELAGDYYFTPQISAGISLEFAGDNDLISFGARWFFR
jgi:hypothetical protein